jgi:signal transduction histidine kinase
MGIEYKNFLRKVPLFTDLPDPDLERICRQTKEIRLSTGEVLFEEGSIGEQAYVIIDGQIEIYKMVNDQKVQLAIRQSGEVIGEISLLNAIPRNASGIALSETNLICIRQELMEDLLRSSPGAARTMIHTVIMRLQSTEASLLQSQKMAQLGTFTAGIAHEINNPSAAVQRGTEQLKKILLNYQAVTRELYTSLQESPQTDEIMLLRQQIHDRVLQTPSLDALSRMDNEEAMEIWLSEQNIENAWELAPHLVNLGFEPSTLQPVMLNFTNGHLPIILTWMTMEAETQRLLEEIYEGSKRISDIVRALKAYVYLDQAPSQEVDIHEGLENTLVILRHKLKQGIQIEREYDRTIPRIPAYGSELNQVWTNLIDNAIDAMQGAGRLTLRTKMQANRVWVEIEDNGPGIPSTVQSRLFDPFFTTKPVGKGSGLGLSISLQIIHKHGGDIQVFSTPGQTRFTVQLPAA